MLDCKFFTRNQQKHWLVVELSSFKEEATFGPSCTAEFCATRGILWAPYILYNNFLTSPLGATYCQEPCWDIPVGSSMAPLSDLRIPFPVSKLENLYYWAQASYTKTHSKRKEWWLSLFISLVCLIIGAEGPRKACLLDKAVLFSNFLSFLFIVCLFMSLCRFPIFP